MAEKVQCSFCEKKIDADKIQNEEVSVNPEVMAGVIHDYYNSGIKLAATTIKNYLENIMNSREDAITLCNKMIDDANQTIAEIHEKLGVEE